MIKNSHCPNEEQRAYFEGPSGGGSCSGSDRGFKGKSVEDPSTKGEKKGSSSKGKEKDTSAGDKGKADDAYYSGEQDDFDIFDIPTEPVQEDKDGLFEAEEESDFEDWEEEDTVDPRFEKEFQKEQS